jgi:hypothetical protein
MVLVPTPTRPPRKGGLKAIVGDFIVTQRLGAAANIQYLSEGCAFPSVAPGLCWGTVQTGDKDASGIAVENGITSIFGQYAGVECFIEVNSEREYAERAEALLNRGEHSELEAVLAGWAGAGVAGGTGNFEFAVAAADQYADQKYAGLPIIMMNRGVADIMAATRVIDGDFKTGLMYTANGTPILASWVVPADKIFVIGWPTVYVSPTVTTTAKDLTTNVEMAIAERLYAVAVDCLFRAVITVTLNPPADEEPPAEDPETPLTLLLGSIPSSPIPDGTDATIIAQANVVPANEVTLHYSINGGPDVTAGEMTQVTPIEFVWNVTGDDTGPGDSVELWATSGITESNHITIEVT